MIVAWIALGGAILVPAYAYVGYPAVLALLAGIRGRAPDLQPNGSRQWPTVSISLPAYNEEHQIADTLDSLLTLDYPADRLQIVVVSDASSDATDEIVRSHADRGVQLIRQPTRQGKTAAENRAARELTGEIVVNTDASIRIHPASLKRIVAPLADPSVGLASGRDVSVGPERRSNLGEARYVGYEMSIRDLETRVAGIVGASGCFYAIRRELHLVGLPEALSRDFASALITREAGLRAVSVSDATCSVPRTTSLRKEYLRKVRTMARGMETLMYKRALLNPLRYGIFSWMLFSHKVCRWLAPWTAVVGLVGLGALATAHIWAAVAFALAMVGLLIGAVACMLADRHPLPRILATPAFALMGNVAALKATLLALAGDRTPVWEPTRRVPDATTR